MSRRHGPPKESHKFWTETLGFKHVAYSKRRNGKMRFYSGDHDGRMNHHDIALCENPNLPKPPVEWSMFDQPVAINHIAISMPSREAWLKQLVWLRAKGVKFERRINHGMTHSLYIVDPNGYGVEVLYELPREVWGDNIQGDRLRRAGADRRRRGLHRSRLRLAAVPAKRLGRHQSTASASELTLLGLRRYELPDVQHRRESRRIAASADAGSARSLCHEAAWVAERGLSPALCCRAEAASDVHAAWFHRALDAGVRMALGSDIRPLKEAALLEMGLWVRDGATPWQTLVAATRHGAEVCGVGAELGTVEVGKLADLIVVAGNPLEDITNVRHLQLVLKEGRVVSDKRHLSGAVPQPEEARF